MSGIGDEEKNEFCNIETQSNIVDDISQLKFRLAF